MNIFQSISERVSALLGIEVKAETGTELDEQLDAIAKQKEGASAGTTETVADTGATETDKPDTVADVIDTAMDDLTAERDLLQEEVDKLTGDIAHRDANITELSDQLAEANKSVAELQAEVKTLTESNEKLTDVNAELVRKSEKRTQVVRIEGHGVSSMATEENEGKEMGEIKKVKIASSEKAQGIKGYTIAR